MTATILVVGGYGVVGSQICGELRLDPALQVIVAGRRQDQASALAAELGIDARMVDVEDSGTWTAACAGVEVVVMCIDQAGTAFVEWLLARDIHYVDITADDGFFRKLEALKVASRASALLSVGLAPGLTNIMAAHCAAMVGGERVAAIGLLLGLGDRHGKAGMAWTAAQMFDPRRRDHVASIDFGGVFGRHRAHALAFADQFALMRTQPMLQAATFLGFESRIVTRLLFGFTRRFAHSLLARRLTTWLFGAFHAGSDICNITVEVRAADADPGTVVRARFFGRSEPATTARLSALMIRVFLARLPPPGIWHSHQVLAAEDVFAGTEAGAIGRLELPA